jgi:hypothetical protein
MNEERQQGQVAGQRQQIGCPRVEHCRVEVAPGEGDYAHPFFAELGVVSLEAVADRVDSSVPLAVSALAAVATSWSGAPLTKARTTSWPIFEPALHNTSSSTLVPYTPNAADAVRRGGRRTNCDACNAFGLA